MAQRSWVVAAALLLCAAPAWASSAAVAPISGGKHGEADYVQRIGIVWLTIGAGGLLFRTCHLFYLKDVRTGLVWLTKILTDPFHDLKLYYKSPVYLLRGELIDPMLDKQHA